MEMKIEQFDKLKCDFCGCDDDDVKRKQIEEDNWAMMCVHCQEAIV